MGVGAHAGKTVLLQRGQRARKRPVWLANTIDPQLADTNRMARAAQRPFSALRYNVRCIAVPPICPSEIFSNISCWYCTHLKLPHEHLPGA